jgi:hypothetical protein
LQMQRVRQLEDQAAIALGVSAVFAEDERLAMLPSFSEFLQRTLADCAQHGKVGGGRFSRLPLRVQRHGFRADAIVGLLAVPVTAIAMQLRSHVEVCLTRLLCPVVAVASNCWILLANCSRSSVSCWARKRMHNC